LKVYAIFRRIASDCTTVTLVGKERIDVKTVRTYDQAKTPYRRVKAMDSLPIEVNARLSAQYVQLNPVLLRANIDEKVGRLWKIVR